MPLFLSLEHRRMMDASEEALWRAASGALDPERRIAADVISDTAIYSIWEPGHLELIGAAARIRPERERRIQLRRIAINVEHRRMIFDYIRAAGLTGERRRQFFDLMFRNLDYETAVLKEHRRYVFAVSSSISMRRLLLLHRDLSGARLLGRYRRAYRKYFDLYYHWLKLRQGVYADFVRVAMMDARAKAEAVRHRMLDLSEDDTARLAVMRLATAGSIRWTEMGTTLLR
ncbi:MAG: hypothetical protein ACRES3_11405 [Steroidobacteraceae bacterium]